MNINIYSYNDYKKYLNDLTKIRSRGFRKELAARARCQTGYITQVLSGKGQFNLDQAEAIAEYLGFDDEATDYFLLLVNHARSGTQSLRRRFQKKIQAARDADLNLKKKIPSRSLISDSDGNADLQLYYSSWHYAAVHVLVSSEKFQTRDQIQKALQMEASHLNRVIDTLSRLRLVEERAGRLKMSETALHLSQDSPLIAQHHSNWRLRAMQSITTRTPGNLHFSAVFTLSREDAEEIRENLFTQITRSVKKAQQSPAIDPFVLNLDFFGL